MSTAISGLAAMMSWKPFLSRTNTSTSPAATTVAARGSPVRSAISPKNWPSMSRASSREKPPSFLETCTSPLSIRKKLSPGAPSSMILSPPA